MDDLKDIQRVIGSLMSMRDETLRQLPWIRGAWIPDTKFDDFVRKVNEAEVHSYVLNLLKPVIDAIPVESMLRSLVSNETWNKLSAAIPVLSNAGFILSRRIRVSKKGYTIEPLERNNEVTWSYDDGLRFAFSKKVTGTSTVVSFVVDFLPNRTTPCINVEVIHGGTKYEVFAASKAELARSAVIISNGETLSCDDGLWSIQTNNGHVHEIPAITSENNAMRTFQNES
jgi:hypothetical protein